MRDWKFCSSQQDLKVQHCSTHSPSARGCVYESEGLVASFGMNGFTTHYGLILLFCILTFFFLSWSALLFFSYSSRLILQYTLSFSSTTSTNVFFYNGLVYECMWRSVQNVEYFCSLILSLIKIILILPYIQQPSCSNFNVFVSIKVPIILFKRFLICRSLTIQGFCRFHLVKFKTF